LSSADPTWKVLAFVWGGYTRKIAGKVDDLIIWKLKYNDKILWQMEVRLWSKTDIRNVITKPYKKWKSVDNYNWKNDPATVYFISNNQYIVINNITWDVVQVSDKKDIWWVVDERIYDIK
jgi:hypothetical protein